MRVVVVDNGDKTGVSRLAAEDGVEGVGIGRAGVGEEM